MWTLQVIELATYYLIAVNFITFLAFGYDKMQAERGGWRVAEATLVFFVVVGGIAGALAGRALFRHKIRKSSFTAKLGAGHCSISASSAGSSPWRPGRRPKSRRGSMRSWRASTPPAATKCAPRARRRCATASRATGRTWTATATGSPANRIFELCANGLPRAAENASIASEQPSPHRRPAMTTRFTAAALPLAAAFALSACGQAADTTYEVDATDEGGGELIVAEEVPGAVEVDTPDTPMTNVPEDGADPVDGDAESDAG